MLFSVCVVGGGVGAEGWGGGDQLSGVGGEYWGVEEFGAGGGGVVGEEEIDRSEQVERDGYALLFGPLSVEKGYRAGQNKTNTRAWMNRGEKGQNVLRS